MFLTTEMISEQSELLAWLAEMTWNDPDIIVTAIAIARSNAVPDGDKAWFRNACYTT
jgi:hypothetical protein